MTSVAKPVYCNAPTRLAVATAVTHGFGATESNPADNTDISDDAFMFKYGLLTRQPRQSFTRMMFAAFVHVGLCWFKWLVLFHRIPTV